MKLTKGFTLIELLVVISIIGVLTAVLLTNMVGIRGRAKDSKLKSDLRQLKTAMRLYYNDNQSYPSDSNDNFSSCSGATCSEGSEFNSQAGGTVYMKELPKYDEYIRADNGDGFYLGVVLNNVSDSDVTNSVIKCNIASPKPSTFYVCAD